jgi:hypothetical protein
MTLCVRNEFHVITIATILFLTGCAGASHIPPDEKTFDRDITLDITYEDAWSSVIKWFALNNISLARVEKESGLIASNRGFATSDQFDCGTPKGQIAWASGKLGNIQSNLNVIVGREENNAVVTVAFFGQGEVMIKNLLGEVISRSPVTCTSTGILESALFGYLRQQKF